MEQAEKACGLLQEYHDIFSLEKQDMGHTKVTKHKIILKDPDTPPFKERFHRIPPPQVDEVREHFEINVGCWSGLTEQQPLVQHLSW